MNNLSLKINKVSINKVSQLKAGFDPIDRDFVEIMGDG